MGWCVFPERLSKVMKSEVSFDTLQIRNSLLLCSFLLNKVLQVDFPVILFYSLEAKLVFFKLTLTD